MTPPLQAVEHAKHVYEARLRSELEARSAHPSRNCLLAASLSDLLEERKLAKSREDLEKLARRYEIDVERIESLARYVNTPEVDPTSVNRILKEDGSEVTTMKVFNCYFVTRRLLMQLKAMWIDPTLQK